VSSAKSIETAGIECEKSLTNKMYNSGPRILPWGTPEVIGREGEVYPSMYVLCVLLQRYDLSNARGRPLMPRLYSLSSRMLWSTVSNAFLRSISITRQELELFSWFWIKELILRRASEVDLALVNPYWESSRMLYVVRKE
jgi:hypothetical protein